MDQINEQLKQVLIRQYSKLISTSETELTEKLQTVYWWNKEQYRLKVSGRISTAGVIVTILTVLVYISIFILKNDIRFSVASSITSLLSNLLLLWIYTRVAEKKRLFELLKIQFDKKMPEE